MPLCVENVVSKAKLVFSDVVDEFHKLSLVKERYEQWKWGFNESYKQAYISLCLPKLFDPFVRLEMIDWNPLEVRGQGTSFLKLVSCGPGFSTMIKGVNLNNKSFK